MARLPEPAADAGAAVVAAALGRRPSAAAAHYGRALSRVLGRSLSPHEERAWVRRAFAMYARYWLEGARLAGTDPAVIEARMAPPLGWECFESAMGSGRGVILALPHVGSWEWGGAWLAQRGYPMTSVAEPLEPLELYEWFVAQRQAMGLTIVALGPGAGSVLLRTLRDGGLVGLLCDRDVGSGGVEVEFFGERTTLPAGPATLALRTGAVLMAAAVYSGPGRSHSAVIRPPIDTERRGSLRADVARVTQEVAAELEALIRRAPDQWHLFQPNWPGDPGFGGAPGLP
ncbi:MAG: phosphatidylinositol mannoside acyltransferase [Acidobacteriota bacterium]|nr:phosphatidylinositol mannoside acyltransferase [Acidobacteriota bacterium]